MSNGEQKVKKSNVLKDTFVLLIITLIAGLALGLVYEITKPAIATQEANTKLKAYKAVFPEAADFVKEDSLTKKVEDSASVLSKGGFEKATINEALLAKDSSGNDLGYVVTLTTQEGYKGGIVISLGYSMDGTVKGMEVLTINETAGLGSKAAEKSFREQFIGKKVESFEYTKTGATADNQIDAITGATITSSAVVNEVNAGICFLKSLTQAEGR